MSVLLQIITSTTNSTSSGNLDFSGTASAASAIIALIALIIALYTLRDSRKALQLEIFDRSFNSIIETEKLLYEYMDAPEKKDLKQWDSLFFNQVEYFSFLVNEKHLSDKKILGFFADAIVIWYDKLFLTIASEKDIKNPTVYPEMKKLYKRLRPGVNLSSNFSQVPEFRRLADREKI